MIEVKEVKTKKMQREFVNFPLDLYKDNPCFVPPLYSDEMKIFKKNFTYQDTCEWICFNAYENNKMVGRIQGILQKASNEIRNQKRVRFCRVDGIDSFEVFKGLFEAVENWAKTKGMDEVVGPLNYSDLEREGLLIHGFDQMSTFEEQYNAPYYQTHIEALGYKKEVDWTESKIYLPDKEDPKIDTISEYIMKRYNLHIGQAKNVNDFLDKYADKFFDLLDVSYKDIYGTVPFTDGMKKNMIENFKLIIDLKFVSVILNEKEEMVCLGLAFPSLAGALKGTGGHLYPSTLIKILKAVKNPKVIDLGLIGVAPDYLNTGVSTVVCNILAKMLKTEGVEYAETNLNLEDNAAIKNTWKRFKEVENKRRRSYVKQLTGE